MYLPIHYLFRRKAKLLVLTLPRALEGEMKAKYRAAAVVGRFGRLTLLITCAIFLTTFRSTPPPAHAQSDGPPDTVTQTFSSITAPETITHTFTNPGSITIPQLGAATPY